MLERLVGNFSAERVAYHTLKLGAYGVCMCTPILLTAAAGLIEPSIYGSIFKNFSSDAPKLALIGFSAIEAFDITTEVIAAGVKTFRERKQIHSPNYYLTQMSSFAHEFRAEKT